MRATHWTMIALIAAFSMSCSLDWEKKAKPSDVDGDDKAGTKDGGSGDGAHRDAAVLEDAGDTTRDAGPDSAEPDADGGGTGCGEQTCGPNETCQQDSRTCACRPGYAGKSCEDIDECAAETHGCDPHAACTNTPGGFECACEPPYLEAGSACVCPEGSAGPSCSLCAIGYSRNRAESCVPTRNLNVVFVDDGFGKVSTSYGSTTTCSQSCTIPVAEGDDLELVARAEPYSRFVAWPKTSCAAESCALKVDRELTIEVGFRLAHNVAFITAKQMPVTFGSLSAADKLCADAAAEAHLHGTSWIAWLSTQETSASSRFPLTARGWVRSDGYPLVDTLQDLTKKGMLHPLLATEHRVLASGNPWALTGTLPNGTAAQPPSWISGKDAQCNKWQGGDGAQATSGNGSSVGGVWTASQWAGCGPTSRIFCFGTSENTPLTIQKATGKVVFLSDQVFAADKGIDAADAICQQDACTGGLLGPPTGCAQPSRSPRSFRALLSTMGASASSRFGNRAGVNLVRPDGVVWLPSTSALSDPRPQLLTGLNVNSAGAYIHDVATATYRTEHTQVRTGGPPASVGTVLSTCNNWTSLQETGEGMGVAEAIDPTSAFALSAPCSTAAKLVCIEE